MKSQYSLCSLNWPLLRLKLKVTVNSLFVLFIFSAYMEKGRKKLTSINLWTHLLRPTLRDWGSNTISFCFVCHSITPIISQMFCVIPQVKAWWVHLPASTMDGHFSSTNLLLNFSDIGVFAVVGSTGCNNRFALCALQRLEMGPFQDFQDFR